MATASTIGRDEELPWGQHKGEPIEDVPTEYLRSVVWALTAQKSEFFSAQRNRGYVLAMLDELESREPIEANAVRDCKLMLDALDKAAGSGPGIQVTDGTVDIADIGNVAAEELTGQPTPEPVAPAHKVHVLPLETIDSVSKITDILKMFVQRAQKEQGLYTWLRETVLEAEKYGDVLPNGSEEVYRYSGLRIVVSVEGNNRIIKSITKVPNV